MAEHIVDLAVLGGNSPNANPDPLGWSKIPTDLNAGAGGEYIYLYVKRGTGPAVTGLFVITGDNPYLAPPHGYTRINHDLNKGAGGDYIYLCYTKVPDWPPITDVKVVVSDNSNVEMPLGYIRIPADLNRGAGGKFIYLCYRG